MNPLIRWVEGHLNSMAATDRRRQTERRDLIVNYS